MIKTYNNPHESVSGTYWDDLRVPLTATRAAAGAPGFAVWKTNGAGSTGVFVDWFDASSVEQLYFVAQMPHSWKIGSDLHPHVHWIPKSNGANNQTVSWGLEYTWANIGATFANTSTIYTNTTEQGDVALVADKHYLSSFAAINGAGKSLSSMIACRIFRDATGAGLTDSYTDDAGLIEFDFHFESDSMGSRQLVTK